MSGAPLSIPPVALSIRQPWAWAIVHGGKTIENRSWRASNPGLRFFDAFAIHAASGMTRDEYESAAEFMASIGVDCPRPDALIYGAIIGTGRVVDHTWASDSPWFFGPLGIIIGDVAPLEAPVAAKGALGYFRWKSAAERPNPKPWMKAWPEALVRGKTYRAPVRGGLI